MGKWCAPALALPIMFFRYRSYARYGGRYGGPWWIYPAGVGIALVITLISYFVKGRRKTRMQPPAPSGDFMGMGVRSGMPAAPAAPGDLPNAVGGVVMTLLPGEAAAVISGDQGWVGAVALFGMIENGLLSVKSTRPLQLQPQENLPAELPPYYTAFLDALKPDGSLGPAGIRDALSTLYAQVGSRVQEHGRQKTVEYYHQQTADAWAHVQEQQDPAAKMQAFNNGLPMLLLDLGFVQDMPQAFSSGEYPMPPWALSLARCMGKQPSISPESGGLSISGPDLAESVTGVFMALKNATFVAASGA